jgi:hypothetical protein
MFNRTANQVPCGVANMGGVPILSLQFHSKYLKDFFFVKINRNTHVS